MDGPVEFAHQPAAADGLAGQNQRAIAAGAPDSPARARLAMAVRDLAIAGAALSAAQEPATRLGAIIGEASRREAEVAALRATDEARLGAWLAGGDAGGPRPEPDPATSAAEQRLEALAADAAAARAALPTAERSFQHCAERVRELQRRRDEAACNAAIAAARNFAEAYRTALTFALEHEAVLHGLRNELLLLGNRPDGASGASNAASRIAELIAETKRSAAVRHNPEAGSRLLAALLSDPDATL